MSRCLVALLVILASGPALAASPAPAAAPPDLAPFFSGRQGCFLLHDLKIDREVVRYGGERCRERFVACSTFKVPLAVMAFDAGLLQDEHSFRRWDGTRHALEGWNADQTARTWMERSVVWFSQGLTTELGLAAVQDYLIRLDYGSRDMSAGLTTAWLTSGKSPPSLTVSAEEQVRFWARLWRGTLPVSALAQQLARELTFLEKTPGSGLLHGKTGSSIPTGPQLGWFVGHLTTAAGGEYVFALQSSEPAPPAEGGFAGPRTRALARQILSHLGLL